MNAITTEPPTVLLDQSRIVALVYAEVTGPAESKTSSSPRKAVNRLARQEIGAWQQPRVIEIAARFGARVWQMRRMLGLDREQLARRAIISATTVSDIEHGKPMDLCYQVLIAEKGLGVPWERINCSQARWDRWFVRATEHWEEVKKARRYEMED